MVGYIRDFHVVNMKISLVTNDVNSFLYWAFGYDLSFLKCLFKSFVQFSIVSSYIFLLSYKNYLYILDMSLL